MIDSAKLSSHENQNSASEKFDENSINRNKLESNGNIESSENGKDATSSAGQTTFE